MISSARICFFLFLVRLLFIRTAASNTGNELFNLDRRAGDSGGSSVDPPKRWIRLMADTFLNEVGEEGVHAEIHIDGVPPEERIPGREKKDGSMRIGMHFGNPDVDYSITEWDESFGNRQPGSESRLVGFKGRTTTPIATTSLNNDELIQLKPSYSGKGALFNAYKRGPGWNSATNNCLNSCERVLTELGVDLNSPAFKSTKGFFDYWKPIMARLMLDDEFDGDINMEYKKRKPNIKGDAEYQVWSLNEAEPEHLPSLSLEADKEGRLVAQVPDEALRLPELRPADPAAVAAAQDEPPLTEGDKRIAAALEPDCGAPKRAKIGRSLVDRDVCTPKTSGAKEYGISRVEGKTTISAITDEGVLVASGLDDAARAAGRTYVIVDLAKSATKFAGAIFRALPSLLGAVLLNPVGIIIGAIIDTILGIILAAVMGNLVAPVDPVKILQRQLFGKPDLTGNEKCIESGQPDCTLLLGATTLSAGLQLNLSDVAALLININDGYPISVPDLASKLVVGFKSKPLPDDALFGVKCKPTLTAGPKTGLIFVTDQECNYPKFFIRTSLIQLPGLGKTPDEVVTAQDVNENRLIGKNSKPDADCKLINGASSVSSSPLPDGSELKTYGLPIGYQCNVKDGDPDGTDPNTVVQAPAGTTENPYVSGSGNPDPGGDQTDTAQPNPQPDGQPGASVSGGVTSSSPSLTAHNTLDAPPVADWDDIKTLGALCLVDSKGASLCLPNGTYNMFKLDTTVFPNSIDLTDIVGVAQSPETAGSGIQFLVEDGHRQGATVHDPPKTKYKKVIVGPNAQFDDTQKDQWGKDVESGRTFDVLIPDSVAIPCVCFWSQAEYKGSPWCPGVGGKRLPDDWTKKPKAIALKGKGKAVVYANEYNDKTGHDVETDIPDLKAEKFGDGENEDWSDTVTAIWIRDGNS